MAVDDHLVVGEIHEVSYGRGFEGSRDEDGIVTFGFYKAEKDLVLKFSGYDFDSEGEVYLTLNGQRLDPFEIPGGSGNNREVEFVVDLPAKDGLNTLSFVQINPLNAWGISDFTLLEKTSGTTQADQLTGTSGADALEGGMGDDTLVGGAGDDVLFGLSWAGEPVPAQNASALVNAGEPTSDADVMTGGDGADLFELVYNTGNQLWLLAALEVGNG